ncbi:class II glutamine amidotransferase [Nocardioides aquiterrae]|uniref:class II glutamine amidotransferase n=1 Tax=Nocardioides aquiterrae TaxID=203799 RepID=UPI0031D2BB7D
MGIVSDQPASITDVLADDLRLFADLSQERHGDGWGAAWDDGGEIEVVTSVEPAFRCDSFDRHVSQRRSTASLVHLRWATMGLAVTANNTHPFSRSGAAFAHNGSVHDIEALEGLVAPSLRAGTVGDTDSERYFLAILTRMRDLPAADAMRETLVAIDEVSSYSSLNSILLTPDQLVVGSMFDPTRTDGEPEEYYHLRVKNSADEVVIASSGWPQPGWSLLPNRCVMTVDRRTRAVSVVSVDTGLPIELETVPSTAPALL